MDKFTEYRYARRPSPGVNGPREPTAHRALRAWAKFDDAANGTLLIGIQLQPDDQGSRRRALEAVESAARKAPTPFPVNSIFLGDVGNPLATWPADNTSPFYLKT
jgi:hypothetical protein